MTAIVKTENQNSEVKNFISQNLESIVNSQPCSDSTRAKYLQDMREFDAWLQNKPFSIDSVMMYRNEYLEKRTDIVSGTKNTKLAALRTLLKELYFRGIVPIDITSKVTNFKTETGHKRDGLDLDEITQVKNHIESIGDTMKRARLKAMFTLLTLQGFRQFEVCNILVEDFSEKRVKIKGKGQSEKNPIDLHPETIKAVKEYLGSTGKKSGYIFTSEKGTTKGEKLTERGFRKIFNSIFDALEFDRESKKTHGFRHFFVTTMLEATNGNIGIVKQFSRHKSTAALVMYDDRKKKIEHNETFYKAFAGI
jgi:integrase/recombinase XerC